MMEPKRVVMTDMASVVLIEDFREILYRLGYGAVRADGDTLHVYDLNPDAKREIGPRFQGFATLYVKPEHRVQEGEIPGNTTGERFKASWFVRVDEGRYSDVMGYADAWAFNPPWSEVVDAHFVYTIVAARLKVRIKGSPAIGQGRMKTEELQQYFEAFTKHVAYLKYHGVYLGRRTSVDDSKGFGKAGPIEVLE
jgi:hypothetical protein